tara:strand:- start:353 stop:706 length:354 start_codon:yes stop_codon:yes gene_type:complete
MEQMVDLAVEAENVGIDSIYLTEAWHSGFVGLAAISAAADACMKHVPEGPMEQAAEAITDEVLNTVTISGSSENYRAGLAKYEGVADQALMVNVGYGGAAEDELIGAFRALIDLGHK